MSEQNKNKSPKKQKNTTERAGKPKKRSNALFYIAGVVILIPLVLLGYIFFSAKEKSGVPINGERFADEIDPPISEEQKTQVKDSLKFDNVDGIEVNLKSATLRINIDTKDDLSDDALTAVMNKAYDDVNGILPIDTYFTNKDGKKMYDLEVHVYNYIPDDTHAADKQIYKVKTKTGAAKKPVVNTLSSPVNKGTADGLLNPKKEEKGQ